VIEGHYLRAMILFVLAGVSDGLDGLLARAFNQKTMLGLYLDPIADKLLLSTLFLVLSFKHRIPWRVTTMVFSRDFIILVVCSLVYATTELRDFRPSIWGKLNTVAQIATVFFAMLDEITTLFWVTQIKVTLFWMTFLLTLISSLHYVLLLERRLQEVGGSHKEPSL
jgi:cardiolipin synthase